MKLPPPLLIINCKTYGERTGALATRIARAAVKILEERKAQGKKKITIAIAVPATDIYRVASLGLIPVLAEHLDPAPPGAHTGKIIAEDIKYNGGIGSLINHSEDQYDWEALAQAVKRSKEEGLISIVCARDEQQAARIAHLRPTYIAVEPPELIGGTLSVSTAQPELITKSVKATTPVPLIVGAGIKTTTDVQQALKRGAVGILVASAVTKAKNIPQALRTLTQGYD